MVIRDEFMNDQLETTAWLLIPMENCNIYQFLTFSHNKYVLWMFKFFIVVYVHPGTQILTKTIL